MSVERPRREDNKGVTNVHTNTPAKLKLDTSASELDEEEEGDDYYDH